MCKGKIIFLLCTSVFYTHIPPPPPTHMTYSSQCVYLQSRYVYIKYLISLPQNKCSQSSANRSVENSSWCALCHHTHHHLHYHSSIVCVHYCWFQKQQQQWHHHRGGGHGNRENVVRKGCIEYQESREERVEMVKIVQFTGDDAKLVVCVCVCILVQNFLFLFRCME